MDRLISLQEAIDAVKSRKTAEQCEKGVVRNWAVDLCVDALEKLPSADRPTGEWIMSDYQRQEDIENGNYLYTCSICGRSDLQAKTQEVPYCWWCGSMMIKGGTE